jgi:DNA-binding response OmpR family regulator
MLFHYSDNPNNTSVLVVDDDNPSLVLINDVLESVGISVITASCYTSALEYFKNNNCSLVLLDIKLKGEKSGLEIAREIITINKDVKIIAITGMATEYLKNLALTSGCDEVLFKPVSPAELVKRVSYWLLKK